MAEKVIKALVEGGKASAGPPLGPTLAPMGVNITEVIKKINEKTTHFQGMSVPVNVFVNTSDKSFRIEVGTPPVSALILKAIGTKKGAGNPKTDKVGNIAIDQIIKIALSKQEVMHAKTPQKAVKEAIGSCVSMGVVVDGKDPRDVQKEVDEGIYDNKILGKEPLKEFTTQEIIERNKGYKVAAEEREKAKKEKGSEEKAKADAKKEEETAEPVAEEKETKKKGGKKKK